MNSFWNLTQCCAPMMSKTQTKSKRKSKYIPPPRTKSCRPCPKYRPPEEKMEENTVYTMSYSSANLKKQDNFCFGQNDSMNKLPCQMPKCQPQSSVCPCLLNQCPGWNFGDQTMNKRSWGRPRPEEMPWKLKPKYIPPKMKMENQTVHRLSYPPPGEFVDYTDEDSDGFFCPQLPLNQCSNGCCNKWCPQNPKVPSLY